MSIHWGAILFPPFLWWLSSFYFLGRWGKYSDDYFFGFRDPVTGAIDWSKDPFMFDFFWRPLHFLFTNYLQTFFWHHQWVLHFFNAAVHGLVAVGIWRLLRCFGATYRAATVGPLLFLVTPIQYDVVFWPAALSTGIATLLWITLALLFFKYMNGKASHAAIPVMMLLAFAVPCFNEQASAGVAALPLLFFCADPPAIPMKHRIRRVAMASFLCALMVALYGGLLIGTAPPWARGSTHSLIGLEEIMPRVKEFAMALEQTLTSAAKHLAMGAFRAGWPALASPLGAMAFGGLAATAGLWLRWFTSSAGNAEEAAESAAILTSRRMAALLFAAALWLTAWVPLILVADQRLPPRVLYFPDVGLALFLGICVDVLRAVAVRLRIDAAFKLAIGVPTVVLALLGSVSMVGFQAVLRERSTADQLQAARLRELVPNPPPRSVFAPLADYYRPAQTGNNVLDRMPGWLGQLWMSEPMVRHTFRRTDVFATNLNNWFPLPLVDFDQDGLRYDYHVVLGGFESHPKGGTRIPWTHLVPFIVEDRENLRLVRKLIVEMPDHRDLDIRFPIIEEVLTAHTVPTTTFLIPNTSGPPNAQKLQGWRRSDNNMPVSLETVRAWDATRPDVMRLLHPGQRTGALSVALDLAPSPYPSSLYFRAALSDSELRECLGCVGVTLTWFLAGAEDVPLAELPLSRVEISRERRWLPVTVALPARDGPAILILRVDPILAGAPDQLAAAFVTTGWEVSGPQSAGGPDE